ncbi:MAG TPA: hypothetical protein VMS17_00905 [Gemmataceae bacterium]|nr:hypothetical protein [Gemmataceae bacterium]
MTDEPRDMAIANALLRSLLWQIARRLKDYQDAPAFAIEDEETPALEVIVPASLREKAAEALAKAQAMLKGQGRGRE